MGAPRISVGLALVDDEGDQSTGVQLSPVLGWFRVHGRDRF
jgi:hypothetical protein